jgi:hypothetical protein
VSFAAEDADAEAVPVSGLSRMRDKTRDDQNTNGWLETLIEPRLADLEKSSICAASFVRFTVAVSPSSVLQ